MFLPRSKIRFESLLAVPSKGDALKKLNSRRQLCLFIKRLAAFGNIIY